MIKNYTLNELLAVNLSKEFKNGEVGFTGLATGKKLHYILQLFL